VRQALEGAAQRIREKGEPEAEKELRGPLEELSRLVLHPLLEAAGKSERWLVSPDGALWLVPWQMLLLPDGQFAVEKYRFSYATSGRDLLPRPAARVGRSAPVVLADPDFDRSGSAAGPAEETSLRSLPRALRLGRVPRLPGTAAEARAVAPSLKAFTGQAPRVFTGRRAAKAVLRRQRSPRLLLLATHGFFLPQQEVEPDDRFGLPEGHPRPAAGWENPLLRCGLLLAGCNAAGPGRSAEGVLTGLEVLGLELRGCELVVLSACETGLGEVRDGEGVAGLRQAFQMAGAQAVLSSLWGVPDRSSAELMSLFFAHLGKGRSKAEALRLAQLELISQRREAFAVAHPLFWAAFTLTGEAEGAAPPRPARRRLLPARAPAPPTQAVRAGPGRYSQAMTIAPGCAEACRGRARAYPESGRPGQARAGWQRYAALSVPR
jgi:CHAT domain-containing protein